MQTTVTGGDCSHDAVASRLHTTRQTTLIFPETTTMSCTMHPRLLPGPTTGTTGVPWCSLPPATATSFSFAAVEREPHRATGRDDRKSVTHRHDVPRSQRMVASALLAAASESWPRRSHGDDSSPCSCVQWGRAIPRRAFAEVLHPLLTVAVKHALRVSRILQTVRLQQQP